MPSNITVNKKQKIKRKIFCDYLRALNMLKYGCHRDQHFEETPKCLKTRIFYS